MRQQLPTVRVAVIDSGWDRRVLEPRVEAGYGFVPVDEGVSLVRSTDDHDRIGHGTACADIVLQVAPMATILPLRVFGSRLETSIDVIAAALAEAGRLGARIANLSLATRRADALIPLYRATERATRDGLVVVASATNGLGGGYPSTFFDVIGVDVGGTGDPFAFSFHEGRSADCTVSDAARSARGLLGNRVVVRGTSFAAPVVTGRIATFLASRPQASLEDVREFLAHASASRAASES